MRNKIMCIFIVFLISTNCCQGQDNSDSTCLLSPMPFRVKGFNPDFKLPDSLSRGRTGVAVLEIFLSDTGKPRGFNLVFIKLSGGNTNELTFYTYSSKILEKKEYPDDVQRFLPVFNKYISRLIFTRNEKVILNSKNGYIIKIPLRLR